MTIASSDLRTRFLNFFKAHGHFIEKSAPLIPQDDPTLLFVNAGMVQFKNVFTMKESRPYKRASTSQKCVRAGGKHNDLENVGQTARHHTFFEMLGNFSFGDYFKEEAITMAWQFLTEELKLDKSRLSVSVFAGDSQVPADNEAEEIWHKKIGIPKSKIKRLGRADNFWQMGDTGPCGPCTEIHYDRGGVNLTFGHDDADDKNIEIWNLVFMQYEMMPDGTLKPLPAPSVDTGMGLERLCSVVNGVPSNYDTDLLRPLIKKTEIISHKTYNATNSATDMAMRVIADHARATAFLIADGLFPGNEGRGYVLRRFMRRAIRHGSHLQFQEPFFHHICLEVVNIMGEAYPELYDAKALIEKVVIKEEETFRKTLDRGLLLFAEKTRALKSGDSLSGDTVFRLYETFGFPADLTEDLAKERGFLIDWPSFEKAKSEHEEKSGQGLGLKGVDDIFLKLAQEISKTTFIDQESLNDLKVEALLFDNDQAAELHEGQEGVIILNKTPFYGESGGQVGDTGMLFGEAIIKVIDTKKIAGLHLHMVKIEKGTVKLQESFRAEVDWARRQAIKRNHSATHLLHSALRKVLGTHVVQKGSLVAPDRLRFDFAHFEALSPEEIKNVEDLVNSWILANEAAKTQEMSMDEAKAYGALALFGEKYESKVRVLDMGSHSTELCGGTHCHRTGDIGSFRIISENPLAQGIRRLEAITGLSALAHSQESDQWLKDIGKKLGVKGAEISARVEQLLEQVKGAERNAKAQAASSLKEKADIASKTAITINDVSFVKQVVDFINDPEHLRTYADLIRDRLNSGVVALAKDLGDNKCTILVAITKDLIARLHAGKMVSEAALVIGGKGGGRPDFAQAGGTKPQNLADALDKVQELLAIG
jgi:alanyl-tRNA synthetase